MGEDQKDYLNEEIKVDMLERQYDVIAPKEKVQIVEQILPRVFELVKLIGEKSEKPEDAIKIVDKEGHPVISTIFAKKDDGRAVFSSICFAKSEVNEFSKATGSLVQIEAESKDGKTIEDFVQGKADIKNLSKLKLTLAIPETPETRAIGKHFESDKDQGQKDIIRIEFTYDSEDQQYLDGLEVRTEIEKSRTILTAAELLMDKFVTLPRFNDLEHLSEEEAQVYIVLCLLTTLGYLARNLS